MTSQCLACDAGLDTRARMSQGTSNAAIYEMVGRAVARHDISGELLVDVGCGSGGLWSYLKGRFVRYCGLDAIRYEGLPTGIEFYRLDLDADRWPVPSRPADLVTAVETIEHLQNPWAFMRQLAGLAKPRGWVIVTTPNQLSVLSLATLIVKHRFSAFQDVHYPAHRTALLTSDLQRVAGESGLDVVQIVYTQNGRIPLTAWHYPKMLSVAWPRRLSDNVAIVARKEGSPR